MSLSTDKNDLQSKRSFSRWLRLSLVSDLINRFTESIVSLFWRSFTPFLKTLLRKCTGLCELQRICYKTEKGAQRSLDVEKCIYASRRKVIIRIRQKLDELSQSRRFNSSNTRAVVQLVEHAVEAICIEKKIKPSIHAE